MKQCIKLNNWFLVQLTHIVAMGYTHTGGLQTKRVDLIKDGYMVCADKIYQLGEVDKVWSATHEAKLLMREVCV